MGLTIHYSLRSDAGTAKEARRLVEQLRQRALDLPFAEVGEVVELKGDACDYQSYGGNDPLRWLVIQAGGRVEREGVHYSVVPTHVLAFRTYPGEDCEDGNFGLCTYPAVIVVPDPNTGRNRRLKTGLKGWCWSSFCKTQYASRIGLDHFVRCHLCVVRMLDHAAKLGILANVHDEGEFWQGRDVKALARQVGEWNESMAAMVGQLKDVFGDDFRAPITEFPDYEHLEARGRRKKLK